MSSEFKLGFDVCACAGAEVIKGFANVNTFCITLVELPGAGGAGLLGRNRNRK